MCFIVAIDRTDAAILVPLLWSCIFTRTNIISDKREA